jgi:hypothetical protein
MGILDDAIREHLELKRQHGAESDDLERLEKEAFGAPARPGDPEFATGEEPALEQADEAPTVAEVAAPAEPAPAEEPVAPEATEAPAGSTDDWLAAADETTAPPDEPEADASPAEQARIEHDHLDDTADHPAPDAEQEPLPPAPEPPSEEAPAVEQPAAEISEPLPPADAGGEEPPEAPERGIFDAAEEFDFDDDLDLDLDEEDDGTVNPQSAAPEAPPAPAEPLPPEPATEAQPSPFEEDDTDNPPLPVQPAAPARDEEDDEGEGGEDLLEGTPDFLQEQPDGDDLWFEQGPPKDFDFDDED